jgi:hypothetical protein
MDLRGFLLNNLRWKLTALLLAMLVWFVIKFALYKGITSGRDQNLTEQPVLVLKAPDDPRIFRIWPPRVDLSVQGTRDLRPENLQVFVDVTAQRDMDTAFEPVLVRGAGAAKVISVRPRRVKVERVAAPILTNSVRKP